jgi:hypothetical protein
VTVLALGLMAAVTWLTLSIQMQGQDRRALQERMTAAQKLLMQVDGAGNLAHLPLRLEAEFGRDTRLAILVQGAFGQVLYQQQIASGAPGVPDARGLSNQGLLALRTWNDGHRLWRGIVAPVQTQMTGAAPLGMVMALDVTAQQRFMNSLALTLTAYVLLAALACALAFIWLLRRSEVKLRM